MTYRECLSEGTQALQASGVADCATDAWILMEYATGMDRTRYLLDQNEEMPESDRLEFWRFIGRRQKRIPVQHITGWQEFMGLPFAVNEHVLIPRQDTELLAEEAIQCLSDGMRFLDLCTGSGCILTSVLKLCGKSGVCGAGADISPKALAVAEQNLARNGVEAKLYEGDLFAPVDGTFDLIVSNPPYIATKEIGTLADEVRIYDPRQALDGGADGLSFYRRIVRDARGYLRPGGSLLLEIGCDQAEAVCALLFAHGYTGIRVKKDLAGLDRVVAAMYNNSGQGICKGGEEDV